ncbi:Vacuolar protein sorting-associated protein 13A [Schistosoma japonicum]|nr:Vacuolar protein sorting-associated protein 13A [Schistosoma japonicum]
MVFESLVVELINRYLGSYIETLNASQLKIGLLGGNAQLDNLDIKANAFDDLDLPIKVLQGHISSLTLKIPFKNLFTEPTIAELTGLYILIVPNIAVQYDETKEKRYTKELKQKQLASVEAARLKPKQSDDPKVDSFGEKLAAQVIKNLQISIKDIHIRYEDSYSIPNRTFSLGLTLSGLTFQTCDSNQKPIFIKDESIREFNKYIKLTSLGVYWNPMSIKFSEKAKVPLRSAMRNSIASPDNPNTGFHYLVKPISSTAMLHIHTRPEETNYCIPQMDLVVNFSEIELCFSLSQYHDITCFLDAQDRLMTQGKYRKFRPLTPVSQNYKVWWHFAYNAILEESVRRRHLMWSWKHIEKHRKISREYIVIWKKKLSGDKLSQAQLTNIEAYEEFLDVFNIVLCRQQAELQFNASKQKRDQMGNSKGGGWFSWLSRSSASEGVENSSESGDLMKRLQTEMTPEEKSRLFAAIDYSESAASGVSSSAINFPASYVSSSIAVTLRQLSLVLLDDKLSFLFTFCFLTCCLIDRASDPNVLKFSVNKLTADVKQRAGDQAFAISLRLDSLEALGAQPTSKAACLAKSSTKPVLITSLVNQLHSDSSNQITTTSQSSLLCIDFEKNPLDRKADQCVSVHADPLQIVYDAETINKIVHFFTPPKDVHLQELSNTVLSSFEEVKEVTTSGLRHLSTNRSYTDVQIDIKPSYFLLPDSGIFRSDCRLLLVDLGSFTVSSSRTTVSSTCKMKSGQTVSSDVKNTNDATGKSVTAELVPNISRQLKHKSGKLTFDELKDEAYDKFHVNLSSVQIIMVNEGKLFKITDVIVLPSSIKPGSVLATRDLLRVTRQLNRNDSDSTLSSWTSDTVDDLHEESEHNQTGQQSKLGDGGESDGDDSGSHPVNKNKPNLSASNRSSRQRDLSNLRRKRAQLIDLKLDFVIRKIEVQVLERQSDSKSKTNEDRLIISFNIHEVGTSLIKRRWTQEIQAHIGTLLVAVPQFTHSETFEPVYIARTRRHQDGHHLLSVQLLMAEKNAPDFDTQYQNTRHRLQCDFKVLDVYIHQEATLLLMNYFNNLRILLSKDFQEPEHPSEIEWAARIGDTEGLKQAKLRVALENEMKQQLPGRLTAADAVESHIARKNERRNIRIEAASLAQKTGKTVLIRELNITQWMVNATLDKVNITLGSKKSDLFSTTVNGLRIDVRTTYNTVEISAILSEFVVIDHILNTSYRKILWVDPTENIASLQITHFQDSTQSVENSIDPDKVDLAISLQIGKLHFIFLYHFVARVLDFLQAYQMAIEMMLNKVQALSDAAVQQVQEAVDKSVQTRLSLNVVAQAPVIYMPQHSLSDVSLMIDFGRITLTNHFEFLNSSKLLPDTRTPIPEPGIMLEYVIVKLENLRLSRIILTESAVQAEKHVILPINFELKLRRNLNPNLYTAIPILLVNGGLNEVSLSQGDYRVLQEVLLDNFSELPPSIKEDQEQRPMLSSSDSTKTTINAVPAVTPLTNPETSKQKAVVKITPLKDNENSVKTTVSFDLGMQSVILRLYTCDQPTAEWHNNFPEDKQLALFNLKQFTISGHMLSDSSSQIIAKLRDIKLKDCRPGSNKQITNYQASKSNSDTLRLRPFTVLLCFLCSFSVLRVLDHPAATNDNRHDELIYIEFKQDALLNKEVLISLRSIHLCASMDYLMSVLDFQLKSTPALKNESNDVTFATRKDKQKRTNNTITAKGNPKRTDSPPTAFPYNVELKVRIDNPELVLIEDIYNADSNALKLTTALSFAYSMQQDVIVMNALINGLSINACPYNETVGGPFSKEILSPSDLSFYASQPINGSIHGTLHMDTLTININPNTIRLLSTISASVQSSLTSDKNPTTCDTDDKDGVQNVVKKHLDEKSFANFWKPVSLEKLNLPYLGMTSGGNNKIECAKDACAVSKVAEQMASRSTDIINIRLKTIRIILESQMDTKSMPMLVLDSSVDAVLSKPATNVELKFLIELSLSYYNDALNQWEPLIETLPDESDRMWSFQLELMSINKGEYITEDNWEEVGCLQASTNSLLLLSRDNLEITISKTALDMLHNLGRSFEEAYKLKNIKSKYSDDSTNRIVAPYRIVNDTGCQLALRYNSQSLSLVCFNNDNTESLHPLSRSTSEHDMKQSIIGSHKDSRHHIWISLSDNTRPKASSGNTPSNSEVAFQLYRGDSELLCLSKDFVSDKTATNLNRQGSIYPIIADVKVCLGVKSITFRSTVQVLNNTSERLCIYSLIIKSSVATQPGLLTVIDVGQSYSLPVELVNSRQHTGIFIGPEFERPVISAIPAYWPEFACGVEKYTPSTVNSSLPFLAPYAQSVSTNAESKASNSSQYQWPNQLMECHAVTNIGDELTYFYNVAVLNHDYHRYLGENTNTGIVADQQRKTSLTTVADELRSTQNKMIHGDKLTASHCDFQMIIQNALVLYNQLPFSVNFMLPDITDQISAGSHYALKTTPPNKAIIEISFEYNNRMYRGKMELRSQMEEYSVIEFESRDEYEVFTLPLGLHRTSNLGQICLTLYAPYWMINKTGKDLTYKSTDNAETIHSATFTGALLYSSLSKSFFGKQMANLRVCESNWSDKFSLDTVGSSGRVHCTTKSKMSYEIGVKIDLSSSGLTKIVTFMPYFIIINKADIDIDCCEVNESDTKSTQSNNSEWIKVPANEAIPFWPHAINSKNMLLKCRVAENIMTKAFPFYESHSILMKLDEKYPGIFVEVETTEETTVITLQLYQEGMALVRLVNNLGDSQPIFYHQSGLQQTVHRLDAGMSIMYAWDCPRSKRELVFFCNETDNHQSNKLTYDCVEEFRVNNTKAYWVSFMWNMQRVLLFTQDMNIAKNATLSSDRESIDQEIVISLQSIGISLVDNAARAELAYVSITSSGVRWSQVKHGNRLKPLPMVVSENLERAYTCYLNASNEIEKASLSIVKLTGMNYSVEVDFNRMFMLKPDEYAITRAFDPGVFLQYKSSVSQMQIHAKLFRLQIDSQRLDSTFPVVLAAYPQPKSMAADSGVKPLFEWSAIIGRTANPGSFRFKYFRVLIQEMQLKLDQGFLYDIIHVSFSLTGSTEGKSSAFPSEVLNLFLQSLGVALTEVQDVIFKLAYFERQACIMTLNQMSTEITHHYVGQGVRQMYVLILGLDVLGNPFGVLRGMAQGVEDLFYEPVKGAVLGPEEFAEGVALGVRSLFGHAVGGAAGAVSRITGTIGKGIAALTLDEEYKRKRREQLARRPETFGAGIAQGGRGLVMGVFHGFTGVVTKPVDGARKEGVEGFFKGFGKGLVGAVTRPVSGFVDFASSSFEGIRRLADTTQEVSRVRPPRFIRSDGIIRPYDKREADGHLILQQVDKDGVFGQYLFHIHSVRGNSALVLTTNDLLIIESMDLLGTFSVVWKTSLENISEVPVINHSGILITLKEKQKKMFTSGQQTKQFDCDLNLAKLMINEIDLAMTKPEHP